MTVLIIVGIVIFAFLMYAGVSEYNRRLPINIFSFEYIGLSSIGMIMILYSLMSSEMRHDNKVALFILGAIVLLYIAKTLFNKLNEYDAIISFVLLVIISPFAFFAIAFFFISLFSISSRDCSCNSYFGSSCDDD